MNWPLRKLTTGTSRKSFRKNWMNRKTNLASSRKSLLHSSETWPMTSSKRKAKSSRNRTKPIFLICWNHWGRRSPNLKRELIRRIKKPSKKMPDSSANSSTSRTLTFRWVKMHEILRVRWKAIRRHREPGAN